MTLSNSLPGTIVPAGAEAWFTEASATVDGLEAAGFAKVPTTILLPSMAWTLGLAGTVLPTRVVIARTYAGVRFGPNETTSVATTVTGGLFPAEWNTFDVEVDISSASPPAPDAAALFQFGYLESALGASTTAGMVSSPQATGPIVLPETTYKLLRATIAAGVAVPGVASAYSMRVSRLGGSTSDTASGKIDLLSVTLRQAS